MQNTPSYYKEKNDDLKSKMQILLERYKKSYPLYKANQNINEYKSMYNNDIKQIQNLFDEQFLLENNLIKQSSQKSKSLEDTNINIVNSRKQYNSIKDILKNNISNNQAGIPREQEFRYELNNQYILIASNIGLLALGGYFLHKLLYS